MNPIIKVAYNKAIDFRNKYGLGNYCANQLINIINLIETSEKVSIKLIRTPFNNLEFAGFIGYKYNTFIIVTNTNHTLGSERFTIAHEIFHLLNNRPDIKRHTVISEPQSGISDEIDKADEDMANAFAAELLMPEKSVKEYIKSIDEDINETIIVRLQQTYGVGYLAITKRLREIQVIDNTQEAALNAIMENKNELERLTLKLGYANELNIPSRDTYLSQKDLATIKINYETESTSYDDLVRIFGYLGCDPEKFGYEYKQELTDEARNFMMNLAKR